MNSFFPRAQGPEEESEESTFNQSPTSSSARQQPTFQGSSHTLAGKASKASSSSKKESAKPAKEGAADEVERTVVLYDNGFMICGPGMEDTFKDYAEEQNAQLLDQITEGRVPLREMNVKPYQKVLLRIDYKQGKQYKPSEPPPTKFSGASKRLEQEANSEKTRKSSSTTDATASSQSEFPYDPCKPTTVVQIRCKNGKRLSIRVNTETRLAEIVQFVSKCVGIKSDDCILSSMTNANLSDHSNQAKTVAELDIQNSVLVQK